MAKSPSIVFKGPEVGLRIVSVADGLPVSELRENGRYEYEVLSSEWQLDENGKVIRRSRILDGNDRGFIEPGNYVGLLNLVLRESETDDAVSVYIDVCSVKLDYETEYRSMLDDIADRCADFLLQLESPVEERFVPDDEQNEATLAQRLYFLKGLLGSEDFQQAIQRIISMPNTQWRSEVLTRDVRRSRRLGRYEVRQFASRSRRLELPEGHSLRGMMETIPERIDVRDKRDTVDTPENRFVKYALNMFLQVLEELAQKLSNINGRAYPGLQDEIEGLISDLEETISHDVFKAVSRPDLLPLNSPVLQRKEGYRQVLRAWMLFELAGKLSWTGGDDVYAGGKRDAAALYEYWVFFKLLDLVAELFEFKKPPVEDLISEEHFVLRLKAGKHTHFAASYSGAGRRLHVEFSYNRTFRAGDEYPAGGSWTQKMRPDYTISLWPDGFTQQEAEDQELITHVHFDAKYRVENLGALFGNDVDNLDVEKADQRAGNYKRADLLKMHAYRDAIRRSAGAYVLYPGPDNGQASFRGFHELLPGLGAFPLRPAGADDGTAGLKRFLKEVVAHVCNRTTQRERHSYHTYDVYKDDPPDPLREKLPEKEGVYRVEPTVEQFVLPGWIKSDEHLNWVVNRGLYNFRTDDLRGSLRLDYSVAGADYLFLRGDGQFRGGGQLFRVVSKGPRVLTSKTLLKEQYPEDPSQPYYLVFDVKELAADDPLAQYDWDLSLVEGIGRGRQSPVPKKGIPLSDFMRAAKSKT